MDRYERRTLRLRNHVLGQEKKKGNNIPKIDDITVNSLKEKLREKAVKFNDKAVKEELYNLLKDSD